MRGFLSNIGLLQMRQAKGPKQKLQAGHGPSPQVGL